MSVGERLAALGLAVSESETGMVAELSLGDAALLHPVSGASLNRVSFAVDGERLITVAPTPLAGVGAITWTGIEGAGALADIVRERFGRQLAILGNGAGALDALGIASEVDPDHLSLSAKVQHEAWTFVVQADLEGRFRLVRALRDKSAVHLEQETRFELSAFSDRATLGHYLMGLVEGGADVVAPLKPQLLRQGMLLQAFGADALVPPGSPVELLVELAVGGRRYRFAAGRVRGRTFRGLLAGREGKLWAERFELETFPGVVALCAEVLGVSEDAVRVLGTPDEETDG